MSLPHSPAATALIALTQTLTLSAAQEHDLQEHDLPRLCLDVPHAIFLVTLGGTHLLVSKSPESQKLLAYHLAHSSAAYVLEQGQFQQATPAQATAYLNGLPPVYVIEAPADRQVLLIRSLSGTPDPVVLPQTSPLYAQAQHLLARRPAFARDAAGHRAHVQHQQRVVELYGQVAHPAPPSRTVPQAPSALSTSALPKSWGTKRYPEDLEYVITHMVEGGQATILIETASVQAHFDAIRHDPWTRQLRSTSSAQFTLLARMTIAAGTSWPDALAQLTARVPSVYRDLPSSVYLPDKKGERVVSFPR
ncbi:hypothetical protein [Deinococcus gobiensis]|uniref:Uncharacterized protein n=1 Tax=Deinococcus gobiensis (strain DSM 21396 / JCM 16679 / CGMCC 1.7299 / I-0) TaxID=745776 RepID=H8H350_DEIGI|nr:hypothetical protein [Deinococcus gobiensis]AFD27947.1 hypothetical protein DGo_PC0155 [Deinococcus gobiensis I-0]